MRGIMSQGRLQPSRISKISGNFAARLLSGTGRDNRNEGGAQNFAQQAKPSGVGTE
jgi:hypothetical protein